MLFFNIYSSSFLSIPTSLLVNINYVFMFAEFSTPICKALYESFCQVLDKCIENYEYMVINSSIKSNNLWSFDINQKTINILNWEIENVGM